MTEMALISGNVAVPMYSCFDVVEGCSSDHKLLRRSTVEKAGNLDRFKGAIVAPTYYLVKVNRVSNS